MAEPSFPSRRAEGHTENGTAWHIHYQVLGSGPDLLLLHGGGPGATGLSNYSKNLDALACQYRCWVIDLPGWGQSSKNLNAFGGAGPFQNGARAVLAFMDAVGLEKAHLVGNSFGGSAALCLAMEHPQRVDKLVLMGPGGGVVAGATGPTEGIQQLLTYYLGEGPTLEKLQAFLKNLVFDQSLLTPELVQQRFKASNDPAICANPPLVPPPGGPGKETFISLDTRLASLPHRALFVWGLQDRVNPAAGMEPFKAMPQADFVLLARCGHWAQWEHAERFNDLVLGFLRHG
ncbi:alpha/beta fold hydrolase [Simplicispira metamorpha]|uniref:2-hydroxy-6-oxonona-2,4-dienedioate hydrolase/4,5:9,10-diseco-3-hydroxy-5,9, 17-trioxoandrosta-1(10),2-diene-4-oate hydrolase n=1 Tax=Simplicispira metamorpha TaxID=80881 RepID=A0A4R2NGT8_9BURK|nr:alpha/beta fold hydrolase [Simplicispira metamorpha]TCP20428.1 2-hydroxy-6-oxonona-2,4-dienedioate hydrolase/4,5:9,10-diseco-3-hydroxy-5,9,17-trioxoandrosta-1(10),2-diene-4-oate hydrolase [Simplicispira metamorpha]